LTRDIIKVTKLDAARSQLRTAIELWFSEEDPISIHTLAFASHEIIHRLYRNAGNRDLMYDSSLIKEEFRADYARMLKGTAAFLKHASNEDNPNSTTELNTSINHTFLTMSVVALLRMKIEMHETELALNFWNIIHHPHWFAEYIQQGRIKADGLTDLKTIERRNFLQSFREAQNIKDMKK